MKPGLDQGPTFHQPWDGIGGGYDVVDDGGDDEGPLKEAPIVLAKGCNESPKKRPKKSRKRKKRAQEEGKWWSFQ